MQNSIIQLSSSQIAVIYPSDCSQFYSEHKAHFISNALSGLIIVAYEFLFGMGTCVWTDLDYN